MFTLKHFKKYITSNKLYKEYKVQKKRIKDLKENYDVFLDLLLDISKRKKNLNFVLRPHPTQDINKIKNKLKKKPKTYILFINILLPHG